MICPICKKTIPDNMLKCPYCKARTGLVCKKCNTVNSIFDYKCKKCGNFVTFLLPKTAVTPKCCGDDMEKILPNTTDGATEKHVPVVKQDGNTYTVCIGDVEHPMMEKHFIQFIALETSTGCHMKKLTPANKPEAVFTQAEGEAPVAVYEYCNLHGLWKTDV